MFLHACQTTYVHEVYEIHASVYKNTQIQIIVGRPEDPTYHLIIYAASPA